MALQTRPLRRGKCLYSEIILCVGVGVDECVCVCVYKCVCVCANISPSLLHKECSTKNALLTAIEQCDYAFVSTLFPNNNHKGKGASAVLC